MPLAPLFGTDAKKRQSRWKERETRLAVGGEVRGRSSRGTTYPVEFAPTLGIKDKPSCFDLEEEEGKG